MFIRSFFLGCFLLLRATGVFSQKDLVTDRLLENIHTWREGSVLLSDGRELSGLLKFDDNTGILSYQNGNDSKTLIAKGVVGFEFYDEQLERQRVFYSFDYEEITPGKKFYFFEVLKEFKGFAVLSKVDPIEIQRNTNSAGPIMTGSGSYTSGTTYINTEIHQTETIYFMDTEGGIKPYLKIVERDIEGLFSRKKTKNRLVEEKLLKNYTGAYYEALLNFADEKDLSFKRKKDIIQILDHYEQLLEN